MIRLAVEKHKRHPPSRCNIGARVFHHPPIGNGRDRWIATTNRTPHPPYNTTSLTGIARFQLYTPLAVPPPLPARRLGLYLQKATHT